MRCLKLLHHPIDDTLVPVITTEASVSVCALHFKYTVTDFEHADVERAAAQVEHQNGLVFFALVESVSKCCRSWFVDDAQHFEAGNCTRFFCCSALSVIEICRHGDHCLRDGVAQICFGIALEFHQCASADFLRRVLLAVDIFRLPVFAHEALDTAKGALWVGDCLALGDFADQYFASF